MKRKKLLILILPCILLLGTTIFSCHIKKSIPVPEIPPKPIVEDIPKATDFSMKLFPCPKKLQPNVEFWEKIYSQYTTKEWVMHDSYDLRIIYEIVNIKDIACKKGLEKKRAAAKRRQYRNILDSIIKKQASNLTPEEERVLNLFQDKTPSRLEKAKYTIRFQLGQKDRFIQGIKYSYRYLEYMKNMAKKMGVPEEVVYIPHVESSFNYRAYSKLGAAGIWQLTRPTGKEYLTIDDLYDERRDPLISTKAAIRHLSRNYKSLKSWPLTVMAYNHGVGGIKKAIKKLGTRDFAKIITRYRNRNFRFASRNFYCEFLAASKIARDYKQYFGELDIEEILKFQEYHLKNKTLLQDLLVHTKLSTKIIKRYNPSLVKRVLLSRNYLPQDFILKLPAGNDYKLDDFFKAYIPSSPLPDVIEPVITPPTPPIAGSQKGILSSYEEYEKKYDFIKIDGQYGWLKVNIDETIGHYSDWADISAQEIRKLNKMKHSSLQLGKIIKVCLDKVDKGHFIQARIKFHQDREEKFLGKFIIKEFQEYKILNGDNLWYLCKKKFNLPQWLLLGYNDHINFSRLSPGMKIFVPIVVKK
ncbi:MAG: transglycosylase SLT domain-containing protein [bacterium]